MPIYEYQCQKCGHEFEREQRIIEDPIKTCPACRAAKAKRLISNTSFVLKGSGWYKDLYSSGSRADKSESASSADAGKSDASASDDAKSTSSDAKTKKKTKDAKGAKKSAA